MVCKPAAPGRCIPFVKRKPFPKGKTVCILTKCAQHNDVVKFSLRHGSVKAHLPPPPNHIRPPGQPCAEADEDEQVAVLNAA